MKIQVTSYHIQNGIRNDPHLNPVSLALRTQYHEPYTSYMRGVAYALINDEHIDLPRPVFEFLLGFDGGQTLQPFVFELSISPINHLLALRTKYEELNNQYSELQAKREQAHIRFLDTLKQTTPGIYIVGSTIVHVHPDHVYVQQGTIV